MTDRDSEGVSIEMLPLPECASQPRVGYVTLPVDALDAHIRANVAHATAAKDAEIERLRAERDSFQRVGIAAQARAERLAEALQWYVDNDDTNDGEEGNEFWLAGRDRARALLRDHDQEVGND